MSLDPPVRSLASIVLEIDYTVQKEANYGLHWTEPNDRDRDRTLGFWTVGETTYNSSWVPINDRPDDFITSDVTVDAPSHWTVIGNGRAIVEPPKNDAVRKVFRWKMDQPHASYLLSLVAGELAVKEDRRGRVPLIYTGPKGTDALLIPTFGRTPEMIAVFERLFRTPYPFAKYAQNAILDYSGGTENISSTIVTDAALIDARSGGASDDLVAHELAHQWFGNTVTCKRWEELWLNEGFATYCESLFLEFSGRKEEATLKRIQGMNTYLQSASGKERPTVPSRAEEPDALFDTISYSRGAAVLHMLRQEVGDAHFFKGIERYLRDNKHRPVETSNLIKAFEAVTKRPLRGFFDQWIYRAGCPEVLFSWRYDPKSRSVVVELNQRLATSGSKFPYRLPLEIAWDSTLDPKGYALHKVVFDKKRAVYRFKTKAKPRWVLLDPNRHMLVRLKPSWKATEASALLSSVPFLPVKLEVARFLSSSSNARIFAKAIRTKIRTESSSLVRAELIQALGRSKEPESLKTIRKKITEGTILEQRAALAAIATLEPNPMDAALLWRVATSRSKPYSVVQEALGTLADWDDKRHVEAFEFQLSDPTVTKRWKGDLAYLLIDKRGEWALPTLLRAYRKEPNLPLRTAVAYALATLRNAVPNEDALLGELLGDSDQNVVGHAIQATVARSRKSLIPNLESLKNSTPFTHLIPSIDDALRALKE